jgi:iron complex transport system ATP-binding protein
MTGLRHHALAAEPGANAWLEHLLERDADVEADVAAATQRPVACTGDASVAAAPPLGQPLLRLHGVHARLGRQAFGAFDVSLRAGDRVAILGPSGAGKSTLLRLMVGDLPPLRGSVQLLGRELREWPRAALSRQRAVLPQSPAVAFGLPVELVVALGRVARDGAAAGGAQIVAAALHAAHAEHLLGRRFDTLSGGERSRVQFARVLAQLWDSANGLLLVDEPIAALDPGLQFELMDCLRDFAAARGHALVAVLHDIAQALDGFSRLWLVHQGRLVADLPAGRDALPQLEWLYGIELQCVAAAGGALAVLMRRRAASNPSHDMKAGDAR